MGDTEGTFEDWTRRGMAPAWWAQVAPERIAIVAPTGNRSYRELNARANQLVRSFRSAGLRAGDGVALLCSNRAEFAEVWAATQRGGFRLTTINWHLTGDEAGYIVDDCEAKVFVAEAETADVGARRRCGPRRLRVADLGRWFHRRIRAHRGCSRRDCNRRHRRAHARYVDALHQRNDWSSEGCRSSGRSRRAGVGVDPLRLRR